MITMYCADCGEALLVAGYCARRAVRCDVHKRVHKSAWQRTRRSRQMEMPLKVTHKRGKHSKLGKRDIAKTAVRRRKFYGQLAWTI